MKIELCAFADEAADSLEEQIQALKRNGITKLELRSIGGTNVKDMTCDEARKAAAKLAAASVSVWSIGSPIGKSDINGDFALVQKDLGHILDLCDVFGCKRVRVFSFFTSDYDNVQSEVVDRMRKLVAQAKQYGVELYHENEKDIFGDKASRVGALLNEVKGLKSVYDPANYVQVGETRANMARMRKSAGYFHIKDALVSGELVPAGEGDGDVQALVAELASDTVLTLEPHLSVFSGYAAIDAHEMKNKYTFASNGEAFDTAVRALKDLLVKSGYREEDGGFVK